VNWKKYIVGSQWGTCSIAGDTNGRCCIVARDSNPRAQPLGVREDQNPPPKKKNWTDHPNFFDEECDYRYATDCSARNWVHHPYFVLYNNLDKGIGPQLWKRGFFPVQICVTARLHICQGELRSLSVSHERSRRNLAFNVQVWQRCEVTNLNVVGIFKG